MPRPSWIASWARLANTIVVVALIALAGCSSTGGQETSSDLSTTTSVVASSTSSPALEVTTSTSVTTSSSVATSSSVTTSTARPPNSRECLARAPIKELVGQLVLATITEGGIAELAPLVVDGTLGGVVLLGQADAGIRAAIAPLYGGRIPPIVGVDEEGGSVQRLSEILGHAPSARRLGDRDNVNSTFFAGAERGTGAAALGFNMVFAPVLDIGRSAGLRSRTYGDDADTVIAHGLAYAKGLEAGGVIPVAKHFPGHGSTGADSHLGLPITSPLADLEALDLVPFASAADGPASLNAIMIGHLVVPDLTDGLPASLSGAAVRLLRDSYGFDGLIVSDDLSMGALRTWTIPEAAEMAVEAGVDLLIAGGLSDASATSDRLLEAVDAGRLSRDRVEKAVSRVLDVKKLDPCVVWKD